MGTTWGEIMKLSEAEAQTVKAIACKAGVIFAGLEPDDAETVNQWMKERRPANWIATVFKTAGISVHDKTIRDHMKGQCQCADGSLHKGILNGSL